MANVQSRGFGFVLAAFPWAVYHTSPWHELPILAYGAMHCMQVLVE
jgi:membrane protease YdiL (CAAX protease family)